MKLVIGEKRRIPAPGWVCPVTVDGTAYETGTLVVSGGATPRVFGWVAIRTAETLKRVWEGEVPAASGPKDLLALAGLLR